MESVELTVALELAIDKFVDRLQKDLAATSRRDDLSEIQALIDWLVSLRLDIQVLNRDAIGTTAAHIKRAIYDGAFDSAEPGRAYVDFDRTFQRWRTQVLYGENKSS